MFTNSEPVMEAYGRDTCIGQRDKLVQRGNERSAMRLTDTLIGRPVVLYKGCPKIATRAPWLSGTCSSRLKYLLPCASRPLRYPQANQTFPAEHFELGLNAGGV